MKNISLRDYFQEVKSTLLQIDNIAFECGVTKRTVRNWINGKTPVPKLAQSKINEILNKELDYEN